MFKTNDYFDGAVRSLEFTSERGKTSVGVMSPGTYRFRAVQRETMRILSGGLSARRTTEGIWEAFNAGDHFDIQENSSFDVSVESVTAYLCEYH